MAAYDPKRLTIILMTLKMLWTSLLLFEETLLYADSSVYKVQPTTNVLADLHLCCSHMSQTGFLMAWPRFPSILNDQPRAVKDYEMYLKIECQNRNKAR